jgi:copper(I)-binding protein
MTFLELRLVRQSVHLNFGAALAVLIWLTGLPVPGFAHGVRVGDLQLDHPYAVPSSPGDAHGKAYLRGIKNSGTQADRLLGASTPVAAQVKLHSMLPDTNGLRGLEVPAIDLPPKKTVKLRHTGDYQLTLINLKKPLKDGDRFDLTLSFEHAGSQTVKVWVQTPREQPAAHSAH